MTSCTLQLRPVGDFIECIAVGQHWVWQSKLTGQLLGEIYRRREVAYRNRHRAVAELIHG